MSISARAAAGLSPPPEREGRETDRPISELYRLAARDHADAEAAAHIREEMKTVTLEQLKTKLILNDGPMPDNKAERMVKASAEWEQYIMDMCSDRAKANRLKVQVEYLKMKHSEWIGRDANARAERRM